LTIIKHQNRLQGSGLFSFRNSIQLLLTGSSPELTTEGLAAGCGLLFSPAAGCQSGQFNRKRNSSMKFHTSGAAGLNSGQSDQKRNFGARFGNRPLLGFAFRYNNGKM
jgi:hypothetical protein